MLSPLIHFLNVKCMLQYLYFVKATLSVCSMFGCWWHIESNLTFLSQPVKLPEACVARIHIFIYWYTIFLGEVQPLQFVNCPRQWMHGIHVVTVIFSTRTGHIYIHVCHACHVCLTDPISATGVAFWYYIAYVMKYWMGLNCSVTLTTSTSYKNNNSNNNSMQSTTN